MAVPVSYMAARRAGDVVPCLVMLAIGAIMVFVVPHVPDSPIARLTRYQACGKGSQTDWLAWLCFIAPPAVAEVVRTLHGRRRSAARPGRAR